MKTPGFWLTSLRLSGPDVEDADISFEKGLNVICGPSDTGKTFILQCINFILGGKDSPKDIPEADGYDTITLGIKTYEDNKLITLHRSLKGGDIEIINDDKKNIIVKAKHDKNNTDTISHILLELSCLDNKLLRKDKYGAKRSLSFRNIINFCIISEQAVQKENSPILTGQYTLKTAEVSLFKLLLTGQDDSSIITVENNKISKIRIESKKEILEKIIAKTTKEYEELNIAGSYEELQEQLDALEGSYEKVSAALSVAQRSVSDMEERRKQSWEQIKHVESQLGVLVELQSRFAILEKQYNSDIRRLEAITETGGRLLEIGLGYCSVCGSLAKYHDILRQDALMNPEMISKSCLSELNKLHALLSDLKVTQIDIQTNIEEKRAYKITLESNLKSITDEIEKILKPKLSRIVNDYREMHKKEESIKKALEILDRRNEFSGLFEEIAKAEQTIEQEVTGNNFITARPLEEFSLEVEDRLKAWHFPSAGRVTFSETNWDVVIGGRHRASHGKGVRAIIHAAFSLALLNICWRKKMPYPNFLIIDSPLVVYREPAPDEKNISVDVKDSFYNDIASSFRDVQVIIIENEDPPNNLVTSNKINLITFTKTNQGRYGFIPLHGNREH